MNLFFNKTKVSFDEALFQYDKTEFESSFRSTIPLLDWIKNEKKMFFNIIEELGVGGEVTCHLEYQIKPQLGSGKASHTDVLIQSQKQALGIEVKWTEPRYDTVEKWLNEGKNLDNRKAVLQGWINYIQPYSMKTLEIDCLKEQVYQMIHRTASVCSFSTNPILAYLQFVEDFKSLESSYVYNDLKSFYEKLGSPEGLPFYYIQILIERNSSFKKLENFKIGTEETRTNVLKALMSDHQLFTYKEARINKI